MATLSFVTGVYNGHWSVQLQPMNTRFLSQIFTRVATILTPKLRAAGVTHDSISGARYRRTHCRSATPDSMSDYHLSSLHRSHKLVWHNWMWRHKLCMPITWIGIVLLLELQVPRDVFVPLLWTRCKECSTGSGSDFRSSMPSACNSAKSVALCWETVESFLARGYSGAPCLNHFVPRNMARSAGAPRFQSKRRKSWTSPKTSALCLECLYSDFCRLGKLVLNFALDDGIS